MASARTAGPGFFPLDAELGLLPVCLTPRLHETLVRLGTIQPSCAKASAELAWHTGTTVHADTPRRRTETAGGVLVAHETAEAERILREHPDSPMVYCGQRRLPRSEPVAQGDDQRAGWLSERIWHRPD